MVFVSCSIVVLFIFGFYFRTLLVFAPYCCHALLLSHLVVVVPSLSLHLVALAPYLLLRLVVVAPCCCHALLLSRFACYHALLLCLVNLAPCSCALSILHLALVPCYFLLLCLIVTSYYSRALLLYYSCFAIVCCYLAIMPCCSFLCFITLPCQVVLPPHFFMQVEELKTTPTNFIQ